MKATNVERPLKKVGCEKWWGTKEVCLGGEREMERKSEVGK